MEPEEQEQEGQGNGRDTSDHIVYAGYPVQGKEHTGQTPNECEQRGRS